MLPFVQLLAQYRTVTEGWGQGIAATGLLSPHTIFKRSVFGEAH
jgi:hypothetical protein